MTPDGWKKDDGERKTGTHKIPDSVWRITRHVGRGIECEHPAVYPIELPTMAINTWISDVLYEPFSGSGTIIIAAEQIGRRCYAMELSPQYVDVAITRWQQFTGKQATLEATGELFPATPSIATHAIPTSATA
jgi:DNA modification methylase